MQLDLTCLCSCLVEPSKHQLQVFVWPCCWNDSTSCVRRERLVLEAVAQHQSALNS